MRVALVLSTILLGSSLAAGQVCPGDIDGSGDVTVDEIVTSIGSALNGCASAASCPHRFNRVLADPNDICGFRGPWNSTCGDDDLFAGYGTERFDDGSLFLLVVFDNPDITIVSTDIQGPFGAQITDWLDASGTLRPLTGSIALSADAQTLTVMPSTLSNIVIAAGCPLRRYVGQYAFGGGSGGASGGSAFAERAEAVRRAMR